MIIIGLIERFYRRAYKHLTIFAKILFAPSTIVMLSAILALAIVEILIMDVAWICCDFIDSRREGVHWSLGDTIRYMMW